MQAIGSNSQNIGGRTIRFGAQAAVVRSIGLIGSLDDLRATLLAADNGHKAPLGDVAEVARGAQPRLGIAG